MTEPQPDEGPTPEASDDSYVELDLSEVDAYLSRVGEVAPREGEAEGEAEAEGEGSASPLAGGVDGEGDGAEKSGAPAASPDESQADAALRQGFPVIPGYVVESLLGKGATGVVYRAKQEAVDRAVALKVMHGELITNRRAVRRLQREARLAAKLAHPSIISAIDMGSIDGVWWYAMELVEGVPLSRRIAERGSLTERECLRIFGPLCDALQHAHEVGVVHRDIKPANILIDGRGRARLVDLGLAMGQNDPSITRTGSTLGTPHYVSPEQTRDPSSADIRSDLWSVGATMYHAVCGRPPFQVPDGEPSGVAEILSRVLYEPVVDPREYAPHLSRGFALMLQKCLTREPGRRYQEPWEMVADIELLRERRRPDLRSSQLDPFASKRPEWLVPALGVLGVVLAMAATWALTARPWEAAPQDEEEVSAKIEDWPALLEIRSAFKAGRLSHAAALTELGAPTITALPERARFAASDLEVEVRTDLDSRVTGLLQTATDAIGRRLRGRDFDGALSLTERGLGRELLVSTGFASFEGLPAGRLEHLVSRWRRDQRARVGDSRRAAVAQAESALLRAYPDLVRQPLDELLEASRWSDAWGLVNPAGAMEWLELPGLEIDVVGLNADEKRAIVRTIDADVSTDRAEVRRVANNALQESLGFLEAEREKLLEEITRDRVKGERTASDRFRAAVDAKHATMGLEVNRLLAPSGEELLARIATVTDELERRERARREALASEALVQLDVELTPLLEQRDYGLARERVDAALAEGWRSSTFDALEARMQEFELLEGVLARAIKGVNQRHRKRVELTFDRIPQSGRIQANGDATDRLGFTLRGTAGRVGPRIVFRESQLAGGGDEHLLEADDLLRLAGLSDSEELLPMERLAAAAFLAAEGRPSDARRLIHLEDYSASERLPADLEARVRRRADLENPVDSEASNAATTGQAASDGRRSQAGPAASAPTFMDAFGTPNQTSLGRDALLRWRFNSSDDAAAVDREPVPRGAARLGGWKARGWDLTPSGLELLAPLQERALFLAGDVGPALRLGDPLRVDQRLRTTLRLIPGDDRPDGHLVAVSLQGYHVLFDDDRFEPRAWFGTGDFRGLVEHAQSGARGGLDGFHVRPFAGFKDGRVVELSIELEEGTLWGLSLDGKSLDFPEFHRGAERADPYVRVRSQLPMTLDFAEVSGKRVARR